MFRRYIKTRLDILRPSQFQMCQKYTPTRTCNDFKRSDKVFAKNFSNSNNSAWLPGEIETKQESVTVNIKLLDNNLIYRHGN